MLVRLVLWSLADSKTTLEELREHLRAEAAGTTPRAQGLLLEAWVSDEATDRFGAVSLWESREAAEQPLPPRLRELVGKDPEIAELFDVEATASVAAELAGRGLALE